jgi:hypothetical protein
LSHATLNMIYERISEAKDKASEAKHIAGGASQKMDAVAGKIDAVAGKVDALALVVATQGQIRDHVERIEIAQKEHHDEIAELMADKHRREGAIGLIAWLSRHWPLTLVALALAALVAWANGKVAL